VTIGFIPYVIKSNSVKKCRRRFADGTFGPSGGNFASDAACVAPQMFVT
jgi:hypothetical protein